jgi:hypothetical protein
MTKKTQHNIKHTSIATLTQEEQQKLLIQAIADFQEEKICLDDLSSIGSSIWDSVDDKLSDFATVTYACSEASYHLRHVTENKEMAQRFAEYMWTILTYYEAHKHLK